MVNWWELLTGEEWLYQATTHTTRRARRCPDCGAEMAYYYGCFCVAVFPGLVK